MQVFKQFSRRGTAVIFVLAALILAACGEAAEESTRTDSLGGFPAAEAPMEEAERMVVEGEAVMDVSNAVQDGGAVQERLIIRTGNLTLVVADTEATLAQIAAIAEGRGGWVINSNVYQSGEAKRGDLAMRIPAEQFDSVMTQLKEMAIEVQSESTSGQDVTEEYVDLESRLGNLEATAARVRSFLDEAQDVEEALAVNAELSRLEEQIEVIQGRMQYLSQSAAFSTISVSLIPDALSQPIEVGWRPLAVVREAVQALVVSLQGVANVFIWLVVAVLPVALLVLLPLFLIGRWVMGRRRQTAVTPARE